MNPLTIGLFVLLSAGLVLGAPGVSRGQDRASRVLTRNDKDGDGKVSLREWRRRKAVFDRIDSDGDGFLTLEELRVRFGGAGAGPAATAASGARVLLGDIDPETRCAIARKRGCGIERAIRRGLFETGLRPRFPDGLACRGIDEGWAISYTAKRQRENYHGGIDMPAPFGTPIIAAAAGTVVAKYDAENSFRGIEIILRHSPEDTGISLWIYTKYTHFSIMPGLEIGDRVRMGQVLGPTGNSGLAPENRPAWKDRRPAIHFATWFSESPGYFVGRRKLIHVDGQWMDPVALYRGNPPFDSYSMKALPDAEKQVPIPVMLEDGTTIPAGTRLVWPYFCTPD